MTYFIEIKGYTQNPSKGKPSTILVNAHKIIAIESEMIAGKKFTCIITEQSYINKVYTSLTIASMKKLLGG